MLQTTRVKIPGPFSYPEPFLRAVNGARQGAMAKSISNWHLIGYNEGYCSNNVYILLPCFYGIRFWIWPEPLVAPRVRRALGTRMFPAEIILVPRASRPRASSPGPGTHGTGSARKLAAVSKAHALELGCFSTRNNVQSICVDIC